MRQVLFRFSSLVFVLFLVAGCAAGVTDGKRLAYVDAHPELEVIHAEAILNGQIMVGMTQEMVAAAWGQPSRVEGEVPLGSDFASRWIYGNAFMGSTITDLYFDADGALVRYEVNSLQQHANSGSATAGGEVARSVIASESGARLSKDGSTGP